MFYLLLALPLILGSTASTQQKVQVGAQSLDRAIRPQPRGVLLVSGYDSGTAHRYAAGTGAVRGDFGLQAIPGTQRIRPGQDGLLYVCSETTNSILRYRTDGTFVDAFIQDDPLTPGDETGGLTLPTGLVFGADGRLYVGSFDGDSILAFDGQTGAFFGVFVSPMSGGLDGPDAGMTFGPDGALWVPSFYSNEVLRYAAADGSFLGAIDPAAPLSRPRDLIFRNGSLFVSSWGSNRILRYDRRGNYIGVFAVHTRPTGMAFDPWKGNLFVTSDAVPSSVRIYNGKTGVFKRTFVTPGGGGLVAGTNLLWVTDVP